MTLRYTQAEAEKLRSQLPKVKASIWNTETKDFEDEIIDWEKCSFIHDDGVLRLSAEHEYSQQCIADYWGEFRGGFPWISPKLVEWAESKGLYWEWQNPGCISLHD